MIAEIVLAAAVSTGGGRAAAPPPSSRGSYSSSSRGGSTGRSYALPQKSVSYQGRSYDYNRSHDLFNPTHLLLWYLIVNGSLEKDAPEDEVRRVYEDQLDTIKDGLKSNKPMPTYEQSFEQATKAFRGHHISAQEIGSTLYSEYSKVGPQPMEKLPK